MRLPISILLALALMAPVSALSAPKDNPCDKSTSTEVDDTLAALARREQKSAWGLTYRSLRKAEPTGAGAFKIGKRVIDVPHGTLTLEGGWVIPAQPCTHSAADVEGKDLPDVEWMGAVYLGEGSFHYDSPHPAESWQLNYTLEKLGNKGHDRESIDLTLDGSMVFFGTEAWRGKLSEGGEAVEADKKTMNKAKKVWKARSDLYIGGMGRTETRRLFVPDDEDQALSLDLPTKDFKGLPALTFTADDADTEEVGVHVLARRNPLNRDDISRYKVGEYFKPETMEGKTERQLGYYRMEPGDYDLQHYDFDMTVYRDENVQKWALRIDGSIQLEVVKPGLRHLSMQLLTAEKSGLYKDLGHTITDMTLDGDPRMTFVHDQSEISVLLGRAYEPGEKLVFRINCGGPVVETKVQQTPSGGLDQQDALSAGSGNIVNFRLPIGAPWFPTAGGNFEDAFTFDWVLRMPKDMLASTSGTMVDSRIEGKQRVQVIKEQSPVFFPAIVFGRFFEHFRPADPERGVPAIRLYTHPGFDTQADKWLAEAAGVIEYYQFLFGPNTYPWQELDLVQMPLNVGYAQAPSGLVQMDGATFYSKTDLVNLFQYSDRGLGIRDNFVPHEIAHFWWGHRVGWASSRDQWLSETLAEYTAALYIERRDQEKLGDPQSLAGYEHRRERWGVTGRMGHTFRRTGPVWIANTIDDSEELSPRRTSSIYARGPLIFDMLRQQFGKEWVMKLLFTLNEVWSKNQNKAVTEDLQQVLEKLAPENDWQAFMDDYIKGNAPLPDDPKKAVAEKQGKYKF
jgi:hypothetical protein